MHGQLVVSFFFYLPIPFLLLLLLQMAPVQADLTVQEMNNVTAEEFVAKLGELFDHSPWIVNETVKQRPFQSVKQMHSAMKNIIRNASREQQLALVKAHPDLAGKAMRQGNMTENSKREQSMLGNLTDAQFSEFETLNNAYKQRFQFPFIISLRDQKSKGVDGILAAFRQRLGNTEAQELEEAIRQIGRISHYRLIDLVQDDE